MQPNRIVLTFYVILEYSCFNNVVIVSGVQKSDLIIYICMYLFFRFFSHLGSPKEFCKSMCPSCTLLQLKIFIVSANSYRGYNFSQGNILLKN